MKKIIFIIITILTIPLYAKTENIQITGLIVKKIMGSCKIYMLCNSKNIKQIITVTYQGKNDNNKYKFKITKRIEGEKEQSFTYYMKDEDKINFKDFSFRLIEFDKIFWFKLSI